MLTSVYSMRGWWAILLAIVSVAQCLADPPLLVLAPRFLQFPALPSVSGDPSSSPLLIKNDTHADMEWTGAVVTETGGNWLKLAPSGGTIGPAVPDGPSSMLATVRVDATGLSAGVYKGTITVTASRNYEGIVYPALDSPQSVSVTYTVYQSAVPSVRVSTNDISLSGVAGMGAPAAATVAVSNAGPGTLNWSAAVQSASGAPWLSITPPSGVNSGSVGLVASPAALAAGSYTAKVVITAPSSPTQTVTVTYSVRAPKPATLDVVTTPLNVTAASGTSMVAPKLSIANSGELPLNWRATASTFNGGQWLSATPASGTNNGAIEISCNASALAPGLYAGRVTVVSDNSALQAQVPVNLTVSRAKPSLAGGGFFNAANLSSDGVVAGSLASIFGQRLAPESGIFSTLDPASPLPTRVTVDGVPAPVFFASPNQINLQIPYEAAGKAAVTAHIEVDGYDASDFILNLVTANVGVFTTDRFRAAALNQDGSLNSAENPAPAGSVVQLYATGQGKLDLAIATGIAAPSLPPFPAPLTPVTVQIGGKAAKVKFAGLAPGTVGMLQLNVEIPEDTAASELTPVQTQTGDRKPVTVYIATSAAQQAR